MMARKTTRERAPQIPYLSIKNVVNDYLLPSAQRCGVQQLLLAKGPVSKSPMPGGIRLLHKRPRRGRRERSNTSVVLARWPESKQIALQFPYLCFVFGGEADIGIDDAVISCPADHAILIPHGTPLTDGSIAHWERLQIESASSDIFWMLLRPIGVECHLCHTRGDRHFGGGYGERVLISNRRLFQLSEMLIDEMAQKLPGYEEVAAAHWRALLMLMQRHLESGKAMPHQAPAHGGSELAQTYGEPASTIERAQRYIEDNLGKPLTLEEIAHAAFVSRAQLAQLFRQKTGTTVWQYITERRFEEAKTLLLESDISVFNIARLIGFPHASYFCTRFAQLHGCSPNEFRRRAQGDK
jgi:AraC-like DNA-binding protein